MEQDLVPPTVAIAPPPVALAVDGRGWVMVLVAMGAIGLWTLRPPPAPQEPRRIPSDLSQPWMADALPGVGPKTRDGHWRKIRNGALGELPERARVIARQVFTAPDPAPTTGSTAAPAR